MRLRLRLLSTVVGTLVLALAACSSDEETTTEPVEGGDAATEGDGEPAVEEAPPVEEAAPEAAATPAPAPEPAPAPAAPAGFTGPKVVRYVTSYALNVRSGPGKENAVVRHVKRGDKVEVVIDGEWAKIGENEYVSVNRLAEKNPGPWKGKKGK